MLRSIDTELRKFEAVTDIRVDQIRAADGVLSALQTLKDRSVFPENLPALENIDRYKLGRGLCLPASSATCINSVCGFRLIGDTDGFLTLGDMYLTLIPFHGYKDGDQTKHMPKGWLATSSDGHFYYHSISTFASAVGVENQPVKGFESISDFDTNLRDNQSVAVSLNNRFVIEQTLKSHPELVRVENDQVSVLTEDENGTDFHRFAHARHVVAVTGVTDDGLYIVQDPFHLPQTEPAVPLLMTAGVIDQYIANANGNPAQGILFSGPSAGKLQTPYQFDVTVPDTVVTYIGDFLREKLTNMQNPAEPQEPMSLNI